MRPSQTFHVLEVLRSSTSAHLSRKGVALSENDSQIVLDVYQQWLCLLIDLNYLPFESLLRDTRRLWVDMIQVDVYDLNSAFAECLQRIRCQNYKGFKALCSRISSHLYHTVRNDLELTASGDVYAAKRLIQLFSYTSRLTLHDIDLTQQQLNDYLEIEESMILQFDEKVVTSLNKIIKRWFGSFGPEELFPQHGPGGVAGHGRCSLEVKYKDLTYDQLLCYAFGAPDWVVGPIRSTLDRVSETIFVPKSFKSFRTISMEPSTLQYFQQGVWKAVDTQVRRNSYLRRRIDFHDQERNQRLAAQGSLMRDYATLDLSAASDSVSYALVKKLFKGTWLLRFLVATRSTKTYLPDGTYINLKKFAPMGSSLCFPIESIIFASICEYVTRRHHVNGHYSVFGDDIIVPTQCAEEMMEVLNSLGFRVNRDKSFYASECWFRESCGKEYCSGFDVTPMRISRKYLHHEHDVRFTKLIQLANTAYEKGFRTLRYFFINKLRSYNVNVLFANSSLHGDNCTNYHLKERWNRCLHRFEVKASCLKSKVSAHDRLTQDERIRYRHWLESTAERITLGDGFESVICKTMVFNEEAWVAKPVDLLDQQMIDLCRARGQHPPR